MASLVSTTPDHQKVCATALAEGMVHNAIAMADLVGQFLESLRIHPPREQRQAPIHLPREFLLELGAVLRLFLWEKAGLRPYLPADLPSARQALAELANRAAVGAASFSTGAEATLVFCLVLVTSLSLMAWTGVADLGADVILSQVDEDELVEVMAQCLWKFAQIRPSRNI